MAAFLLVHGACHGAWCWRDLLPELRALGHEAHAIDLPSHGADTTPYQDVTLDLYASALHAALTTFDTPPVLVGHSMAGYPITLVAEQHPHLVQHLVYLCAYVPKPGLSLSQRRMEAKTQPLLAAIHPSADRKGWFADPAKLTALFYNTSPPGTADYARPRLTIQSTAPTAVPVHTTARYDNVARSYIRCSLDQTIPPDFQIEMTQDWPCDQIVTMECDHSPFFSAPQLLAHHLDHIAKG